MLNSVDGRGGPADAIVACDLVDVLAAACSMSPAEQVLLDWLGMQMALVDQCAHDGVAGWEHRSAYELVAARGRWFTPAALPAEVRPLPERECFANAVLTEREHPHLAYTEGFAVAPGIPVGVAHAWCTDSEGRVVDPTWSDLRGGAYLGIVLPPDIRPQRHRSWGALEGPDTLFPLLRNGLRSRR